MFRVPEISHLRHVAHAAARVDDGIAALVTHMDPAARVNQFSAYWGCSDEFARVAAGIPLDAATSCAQAARERRRVVVRDVRSDPGYAPYLAFAELAGFRGVQSTPLIDRHRKLRGVLSTLFAEPHHPSTDSLALIDACARVATTLIEAVALHEAVVAADQRMGIPARSLSIAAAQAADAARMLLPALPRAGGNALLEVTERHLEVVIDELNQQIRREGVAVPITR